MSQQPVKPRHQDIAAKIEDLGLIIYIMPTTNSLAKTMHATQ